MPLAMSRVKRFQRVGAAVENLRVRVVGGQLIVKLPSLGRIFDQRPAVLVPVTGAVAFAGAYPAARV